MCGGNAAPGSFFCFVKTMLLLLAPVCHLALVENSVPIGAAGWARVAASRFFPSKFVPCFCGSSSMFNFYLVRLLECLELTSSFFPGRTKSLEINPEW